MCTLLGLALSAALGCDAKVVMDAELSSTGLAEAAGGDTGGAGGATGGDTAGDTGGGAGGGFGDTAGDTAGATGGPVDVDGDGYDDTVDCDDADPGSHPGGVEQLGDGADNDCDGLIDEVDVCDDGAAPHTSIQAAAAASPDGSTLVICPGTYRENVALEDRELTLLAPQGPSLTRLESADGGTTMKVSGSAGGVVVQGLAIGGGRAPLGGAVLCDAAPLTLQGVAITGGVASQSGGGLYARRCTLVIEDSEIADSSAGESGGGLGISGGAARVSGSVIHDNVALEGGGVHVTDGDGVDLLDNWISNNQATTTSETTYGEGSGGGGILYRGGGTVAGNVIEGNVSGYNGGGLYVLYEAATISGNTFRGNSSGEDGGGAYGNQPTGRWTDNRFEDNEAFDDAGGLRIYRGRTVLTGNTFVGNRAGDDAGGLKLSHSTNTIEDNYFEANSAGDAGGGMELDNETSDVTGCTFVDNTAARGGGLHSWRAEGRITISDSSFIGNVASGCGGAIEIDNSPLKTALRALWIEGNQATDGAGICTEIADQEDELDGIQYEESRVAVLNSVLVDNYASDDGGGLYLKAADAEVTNVVVYGNRGDGDAGGVVIKEESDVIVINAVISDNAGEGVYLDSEGSAALRYSDVSGNDGDYGGAMGDPTGRDGNISQDPRFVDPAGGDFTLLAASPCIDAGSPELEDVDGSRSDMGAYGGPFGAW